MLKAIPINIKTLLLQSTAYLRNTSLNNYSKEFGHNLTKLIIPIAKVV
jgi:hypothetical protein